jgi:hypothetical protein
MEMAMLLSAALIAIAIYNRKPSVTYNLQVPSPEAVEILAKVNRLLDKAKP